MPARPSTCRRAVALCCLALVMAGGAAMTMAATTSARDPLIEQATDYPERWQRDLRRDLTDRPSEVLAFSGVAPGMQVLDLFSGNGYWSELFARAVGAGGQVVAHTNDAYRGFVGDLTRKRFANRRVPRVKTLVSELDDLELGRDRFDLVFFALAYHDLYYHADYWPQPGRDRFFRQLRAALKPGGTLLVIDHAADGGTGTAAAQTLHRIDEAFARQDIVEAGFEYVAESDALRNNHDDRLRAVFDAEIRGRTDRFMIRFRRPLDPAP